MRDDLVYTAVVYAIGIAVASVGLYVATAIKPTENRRWKDYIEQCQTM